MDYLKRFYLQEIPEVILKPSFLVLLYFLMCIFKYDYGIISKELLRIQQIAKAFGFDMLLKM